MWRSPTPSHKRQTVLARGMELARQRAAVASVHGRAAVGREHGSKIRSLGKRHERKVPPPAHHALQPAPSPSLLARAFPASHPSLSSPVQTLTVAPPRPAALRRAGIRGLAQSCAQS